jgi:hypothetical protein
VRLFAQWWGRSPRVSLGLGTWVVEEGGRRLPDAAMLGPSQNSQARDLVQFTLREAQKRARSPTR